MRTHPESRRPSLTLVVPLFDEQAAVPALCDALTRWLDVERAARAVEVVLVDDGSRDRTAAELAARLPDDTSWRLLRHDRNQGLTAALRTGTLAARHELVGWLDADLSYDPTVVTALAAAVDTGADVGLASCHHAGGRMQGVPAFRRWLSRGASRLYRLATGHRLATFTCMVRVQRRDLALRTWPVRPGFLGITEQLLRVLDLGATVHEVPAVLRARTAGRSKMQIWRATRAHLGLVHAARRHAWPPAPVAETPR